MPSNADDPRRPGNARKVHDNRRVSAIVGAFDSMGDLCECIPGADDIFTGAASLKTEGHTATRPLSRAVLFRVLAGCPHISTEAVVQVTHGRYARAQTERYAAHARVASKALARLLDHHRGEAVARQSIRAAQRELDAPYLAALERAGDLGTAGQFLTYL